MTLLNKLNHHMKEAMKEKDKDRLSVIRMVKASLQNEMIALGVENLSEEDELSILTRELKQRNDSLTDFKNAGRKDLVEKIEKEITILKDYLPEQLTEKQLIEMITKAISTTGASSPKEFGKVMGLIMPKVKGKADGAVVQKLVKDLLTD